jgi:hypothetical protein
MRTDSISQVQDFALKQVGQILHDAFGDTEVRYDTIRDEWSLVIPNHEYDRVKPLHAVEAAA